MSTGDTEMLGTNSEASCQLSLCKRRPQSTLTCVTTIAEDSGISSQRGLLVHCSRLALSGHIQSSAAGHLLYRTVLQAQLPPSSGICLAPLENTITVGHDLPSWKEGVRRPMGPSPEYPTTPSSQWYVILALGSLGDVRGCR